MYVVPEGDDTWTVSIVCGSDVHTFHSVFIPTAGIIPGMPISWAAFLVSVVNNLQARFAREQFSDMDSITQGFFPGGNSSRCRPTKAALAKYDRAISTAVGASWA